MRSIRETATEIAKQYAAPTERFQAADAIEQALRDERERAAKIVEDRLPIGADDCAACEQLRRLAERIRED